MLQRVGDKRPKIFGKLDLTSGYHQAPIDKESRSYTAFITHMGVYEWNRAAMGLKGAGPWFQQILAGIVLIGLIYHICELYIDDLMIFGQTDDEFCDRLDQCLTKLEKHNVIVNPDKCEFGLERAEFVGHTIDQNGLCFTREKIDKVLQIPPCIYGKDLKSFLGVAVYFIDHIRNYATLVHPLHKMLKDYNKNRKLIWTPEAILAFETVKEEINLCTTLYFIDDVSPILLYTDASDYGIGAYLCQVIEGKEVPIAFVSHGLSEQEIRWSTIEKECYAIVYALEKLDYLLSNRTFTIKTDHKNLTYIDADKNPKVKRWKIAIQGYEYLKGPTTVIADPFSRLVNTNNDLTNK